eukprot:TRINITY_DN2998_c0_g1_i1.p1 TRINITY_DN2998_c0_g1~~TRINITY_DN2998_c0_g1_i1.p1  ORF type:complete len:252 (+),score=45.95 TRINITY_DN2998_c0_g1_i1:123-878(+)
MPMLEMKLSPREVSLPLSTLLSTESSPTGMIWRRSGTTPSTMSSVFSYPSARGLSRQDVDKETRKAFSMWQEVSDLRFEETSSRSADIEIRFEKYSHGDGNAFDGPGGVLAHAFYPRFGGDAHFDDSENWSVTPFVGNQLLNTLTHELGHSLGLRHSNKRGSIMAPFYKGWDPNLKLEQDDRDGIQALYGPPSINRPTRTEKPISFSTTVRTTTRKSIRYTTNKPSFPVPGTNNLCSSKLDTVVGDKAHRG